MLTLGNKLTLNSQPIYHFVNKYSIDFDGSDEVIVTDGADTIAQPTTYAFWCKSSTTGANFGVFGHGSGAMGSFHMNFSGKPLLELGANYFRLWNDNPAQDDGKWHQWVVYSDTNDITNSKLYVDSVLQTVSSTTSSGTSNSYTESLNIGGDKAASGNYFEGQIDEFAVYDRELKQDEITRMYNTYYTPNRVANGNFAQIGNEEVSNGDFSEIGSELVINGTFLTNTTTGWNDWLNITNPSNTSQQDGYGILDATTAICDARQEPTVVAGKTYKIEATLKEDAGSNARLFMSDGANYSYAFGSFTATTTETTFVKYVVPTQTVIRLYAYNSGSAKGYFKNISVKEVGQDWSFGTSWSMGDGKAIFTTGSSSLLSQDMGVVAGKSYEVYLELTGSGGNFYLGTNTSAVSMPVGTYTLYLTAASGANSSIGFLNNGGAASGTLDNVSVKEVGQNWTFGSAWSTDGTKAIYNDSAINSITQTLSLFSSKSYKIQFKVSNSSGLGARMKFGNSPDSVVFFNYAYYTNGEHTLNYNATSNSTDFNIKAHTDGSSFDIDNIVVQELKSDATNLMLNAGAYQSANPLITSTKSMEFDGADDYLTSESPTIGTEFTVSAWINTSDVTVTGGSYAAFFSTGGYGGGTTFKIGIRDDNGKIEIWQGGAARGTGTSNVGDGKWHLITYTKNSTQAKIYVDGILETTTAYTTTLTFPYIYLGLGGSNSPIPDNGGYFNGLVTELGVYDRVLTDLEVASLYNQGMPTNLLVNRNDYQSGNPTVFNTKLVDFEGVDDYLIANSTLGSFTGSVSIWVNRETNTGYQFLTDFRADSGTGFIYFLLNSNNLDKSSGTIYVDGITGITVPTDGNWHQVVVTGIVLNIKEYITFGIQFGKSVDALNGQMSQIGMWNSTLTADEVSSLYNHGLPIDLKTNQAAYTSSSNLVGYWRMGGGTLDSFPVIFDQTNATEIEIIVNGDFATDSNWIAGNWTYIGNGFKIVGASGVNSSLYQIIPVVNGKTYTFSYTRNYISGGGITNIFVQLDGSNYLTLGNYSSTVVEEHTVTGTFVAGFTGNLYWQIFGIDTFTGTVTNASVKLLGGSPAIITNMGLENIKDGSPYAQLVQNSDFATDSNWTKGTGWTIANGKANATSASSDLFQIGVLFSLNKTYKLTYTISNYSQGNTRAILGGYALGSTRNTNGTFTDILTPTNVSSNLYVYIEGQSGFTGSIDNVTLTEVNTGLQGYWKMGDGINDEFPIIYDQTNPTNGAELVTNGDVESALPTFNGVSFTNYQSANTLSSLQSHLGTNSMKVTGTATLFNTRIIPNNSSYLNKTFKVSLWVYNPSTLTGDIAIRTRINAVAKLIGTLSVKNTWTNYTYYMTSTNTASDRFIEVESLTGINTQFFFIDDISVKEVQGNPATMTNMVEGNITNQYPLTKIRNYYRMGDGILDGFPIIQDQTSPNLAHIPTTNLILYSEDFSSYSPINGIVVESGQTDPLGTNTAYKLTNFALSGSRFDYNTTTTAVDGSTYTYSAFYKGSGTIRINCSTSTGVGGAGEKDIVLTNEWTRQQISFTAISPTGAVKTHTAITRTPNNDAIVYLAFTQIEEQSQATAYIKSDGIEAVRKSTTTNLVLYSEDFSQSYWSKVDATVAHGFVAPDGTNNAFELVGASGTTRTANVLTRNFSAGNYTFSLYVKSSGSTQITFYFRDGTTGAIVSKLFALTSEYQRLIYSHNVVNLSNFYIGNTNGDVIIWGAQLEEQTQAETYAPTFGLPVTIDLFTENNYGTMTNMVAGDIVLDTPNNPA